MGNSSSNGFDYQGMLFEDLEAQSASFEGHFETPDAGGPPRRHAGLSSASAPLKRFPTVQDGKQIHTLWEAFQHGVSINGGGKLYGTRVREKNGRPGKYAWISYQEADRDARAVAAGLRALCGVSPQDNIGIYSKNRVEWSLANAANFSQSIRTVALYDTLGSPAVAHILRHANLRVVFCSKDKVSALCALKRELPDLPLQYIVQFDENPRYRNSYEALEDKHLMRAETAGVELLGFSALVAAGRQSPVDAVPPSSEDLALIMYTSGTTGVPKGAMLSHGNLVATVAGAQDLFPVTSEDVHCSYLPLAHIFETVVQTILLGSGGAIGFFQGDVRKLSDDWNVLKPTILCGVPRVFSKVYSRIVYTVESTNCIKTYVFHKALADSAAAGRLGQRNAAFDRKVWIPMRNKLGLDGVKLLITGAAPMPPYLVEFLKVLIGCKVVQGYGMTETAAAVAVSLPDDLTMGHVGPPLSCSEIRLVDIPDMKYLSTDSPCPRGEVWVRGPNVFKGYLDNADETAKVFPRGVDAGWLATGDVGRWNPNGTLSIIDRKKNMFKLAHGEYVGVEKVESTLGKAASVAQVWVYGNSFKSFLVAIVVPDAMWLVERAREKHWWPRERLMAPSPECRASFGALVAEHRDELTAMVQRDMRKAEAGLKRFEKLAGIWLEGTLDDMLQGFNVANDCLTPSFKLRRQYLLGKYIDQLKDMYSAHGEPPASGENWGTAKRPSPDEPTEDDD